MKISSTAIRKALKASEIKKAHKLLGYPYQLKGKVIHGEKLGKKIGFRTANIQVEDPDKLIPGEGIYAALVHYQNQQYKGMRSEEHTSELQSRGHLVCRLLLEKKKKSYN